MRIDKFLKVSRIIKRRSVAKEMADNGRVYLNDKEAKSSSKVKTSDIVTVLFGQKKVTVKVLQLLESTKKEDASKMYELISEEFIKD